MCALQDVPSCHSCGFAVSELACEEEGTTDNQEVALLTGWIWSCPWPSERALCGHQQTQSTEWLLKNIYTFTQPSFRDSIKSSSVCFMNIYHHYNCKKGRVLPLPDCDWLHVVNLHLQILPQDVLVSESGELSELGRSYVPPRVLLDALCTVCSSASQWSDPAEAENLAMEILIVTHHPSIGERMSYSAACLFTAAILTPFILMTGLWNLIMLC